MQLAGIKISNLFSFPYLTDIQNAQEVTFYNSKNKNVHVLIGPNGAGKSKFLDIIRYVLRHGLRKDYTFDHGTQRIQAHSNPIQWMYANYSSPEKPSEVIARLTLTDHDYDNLRFLCTYYDAINTIIRQHSDLEIQFAAMNIDDIVLSEPMMSFHCVFDVKNASINVVSDRQSSLLQEFVLKYLLHNELIQICIDIHNAEIKKEDWADLYSTFAVLGLERTTLGLPTRLHQHDRDGFVYERGQYSARAGYYLCAQKIRQQLSPATSNLSDEYVTLQLQTSEFFLSLSAIIQKYFEKTLRIVFVDNSLEFSFVDALWRAGWFESFSDGEQSLLIIIMTIYGYDLHGWLLIIDEPEIHFHPQMQRSLARMMEMISDNMGTQFMLSTYSPLFINESNINHVYRFAKINWSTQIKSPALRLTTDEASLVHLLKFENIAKIFFVNNIIMVEGETDEYFFEFYLRYLHTLPEWKGRLRDYEIININGKGSYKIWKKFLSKFGISSFFIWDWDNIVDYGFMTQTDLTKYYKQAKTYFPKVQKTLAHGSHYNKLVLAIKGLYPNKYQEILAHIRALHSQQVFLLEKWDIETYLKLKEKWLQSTVDFCRHNFKAWLADPQYELHRKELLDIVWHIFSV